MNYMQILLKDRITQPFLRKRKWGKWVRINKNEKSFRAIGCTLLFKCQVVLDPMLHTYSESIKPLSIFVLHSGLKHEWQPILTPQKIQKNYKSLFYATFQCGRYNILKRISRFFFAHKKLKKPTLTEVQLEGMESDILCIRAPQNTFNVCIVQGSCLAR